MRKAGLWVIAAAMLLSSCAQIAGSGKAPSALGETPVYYDTQTVIGDCPDSAEAGLLAGLGAAVIAQGVNRIGDAIRAAGGMDTQVVVARRNIELKSSEGVGPCVQIARGWFYRYPPSDGTGSRQRSLYLANPSSKFPLNTPDDAVAYWRTGLHLAATPDFYFKGIVKPSIDSGSFVLAPRSATLDIPISKTALRPGNKRMVLVSVAIGDNAVDLSKGAGATLALGAMRPGELLEFPETSCVSHLPVSATSPTDCPALDSFHLVNRTTFESGWFTVARSEKTRPMTIQALVSETRSPSQFLLFVSDVFAATKGTATEELQKALIPSIGDAADEAAATADEKEQTAFDTALSKAITELSACVNAPAEPSKRIAGRVALRNLVQAARPVGNTAIAEIKPDLITTTSITPDECKAALEAVLK